MATTIRQQAIQTIKDMDYSDLRELVVKSHDTNSHKWMEVYPDGSINEAEEADNNSAHYISYPDKEVATIFNINNESCEACGCDICVMYRHFSEGKEAFILQSLKKSVQGRKDKTHAFVQELQDWQKEGYVDAHYNARVMYDELDKLMPLSFGYEVFKKYYNNTI